MQVLSDVNRQYHNLFGGDGEANTESGGTTFYEKWGWIATINDITNNDRTKWDYFFKMNVIEFLNTVSFYKDKNEHEKQIIERAKRNG